MPQKSFSKIEKSQLI